MNQRFRTLFISDVHLGAKDCQAELLLQKLQQLHADHIYLLGDIIDLWAIKKSSQWRPSHSAVLTHLRALAAEGVRITYVPGNHDAPLRQLAGKLPLGVELQREASHVTARGERLLLIHGDCFDQAMHAAPWLYWLGDRAYDLLLFINRAYAHIQRWRGRSYWSLAGFIKNRLGKARQLLDSYQRLALARATAEGYDGIVCGHIHQPALLERSGKLYANCGDWVESCTLLAELPCGQLQLLSADAPQAHASAPTRAQAQAA